MIAKYKNNGMYVFRERNRVKKDWFIIKHNANSCYIQIGNINFPKYLEGAKVKVKIEFVDGVENEN